MAQKSDSIYAGARPKPHVLIDKAAACAHGILLTSYEQLRKHADDLLDVKWGYVALDEGHRIRNPDADITLLCKQVCCCVAFQVALALSLTHRLTTGACALVRRLVAFLS